MSVRVDKNVSAPWFETMQCPIFRDHYVPVNTLARLMSCNRERLRKIWSKYIINTVKGAGQFHGFVHLEVLEPLMLHAAQESHIPEVWKDQERVQQAIAQLRTEPTPPRKRTRTLPHGLPAFKRKCASVSAPKPCARTC